VLHPYGAGHGGGHLVSRCPWEGGGGITENQALHGTGWHMEGSDQGEWLSFLIARETADSIAARPCSLLGTPTGILLSSLSLFPHWKPPKQISSGITVPCPNEVTSEVTCHRGQQVGL
jgi:hypothetical protein